MQVRIFRVPFAELGELGELEFGEQDYLMVRPLFALPRGQAQGFVDRVNALREGLDAVAADQLICDLVAACVTEWHLAGADGQAIPQPRTAADLNALPGGLAGALAGFFWSYRGTGAHPTTAA